MEIALLIFDLLFLIGLFIAWMEVKKLYKQLYDETHSTNATVETLRTTLDSFKEELSQWRFLLQAKPAKPAKNDIEQKEVEEIDLDDGFRVPLTGGVKIQFEGDKKGRPINIVPMGE